MSANVAVSVSAFDEWAAPQNYFDVIDERYGPFLLDVCATPQNAKCERFYTKDGLAKPWSANNWMNPPYGCDVGSWIKRAFDETKNGNTTVALLPARIDARLFQEYICGKQEFYLLGGCTEFGGGGSRSRFSAMLVIFGRPPRT
ncbi:DNA N-6-adenine-methyltransferase [Bradyrhizobium sp. LMTR 3]|uniref:DNA N-6-adenine-methyltransferase n=1 Tax=Bradyrhizobium sp. LMTR 3 TaxID=189873 RepID=UPI0008106FC7|nr:DNA N-6-adenine-methyltransferase [Bradyrhizobium sp. LMTR 3]OCK55403.1 hypothetical protein LMTR3_11345 [Bradyrhizobium sp. LMTR 3]